MLLDGSEKGLESARKHVDWKAQARDCAGIGLKVQRHAIVRGCTADNCTTGIYAPLG